MAAPSPTEQAPAIQHYENFPVASWLCPRSLRPAIRAIYHFARTADDLADEGACASRERLANLAAYRAALEVTATGSPPGGRWQQVWAALAPLLGSGAIPVAPFHALLDAFEQDVVYTATGRRYADDAELLHYCARSANPIGRLLLHLYRVEELDALQQSDQICTALQCINFWQDLRVDIARGRWYPTAAAMDRFGVTDADLAPDSDSVAAACMVAAYVQEARHMMDAGSPLCHRLPGRIGWELRCVVQGGLRILDKIEAMGCMSWRIRPVLTAWDVPVILGRAWGMKKPPLA
ncbi:squalene synthase HpnC [Candidatus Symbiobacter mobilis]|uniref:Phytoene synthase-like protein n=1 Tax=Candidatus Symbiobacter mobilis CR TaxID=946483 RepID=U5NA22_9BURK|nr:squalene synthase HpnC [Candidatus Symbiobacter mobilis]AGX87103.1 phytoene synthase-like protein [Candidatus Symbiobacter mobilis CR]